MNSRRTLGSHGAAKEVLLILPPVDAVKVAFKTLACGENTRIVHKEEYWSIVAIQTTDGFTGPINFGQKFKHDMADVIHDNRATILFLESKRKYLSKIRFDYLVSEPAAYFHETFALVSLEAWSLYSLGNKILEFTGMCGVTSNVKEVYGKSFRGTFRHPIGQFLGSPNSALAFTVPRVSIAGYTSSKSSIQLTLPAPTFTAARRSSAGTISYKSSTQLRTAVPAPAFTVTSGSSAETASKTTTPLNVAAFPALAFSFPGSSKAETTHSKFSITSKAAAAVSAPAIPTKCISADADDFTCYKKEEKQ